MGLLSLFELRPKPTKMLMTASLLRNYGDKDKNILDSAYICVVISEHVGASVLF